MKAVARISTDFWVGAYLNNLRIAGIPAFVVSRGNSEAGSVLIRSNTLDGRSRLFQKSYNLMMDREVWVFTDEGEDSMIDGIVERQMQRDTDLWIIEVEDREGRTLLETDGFE